MTNAKSVRAYRNAGLDAAIASASPHQLILMLFEGARIALSNARRAIDRDDVTARGQALSKAAAIIDDGLKASLDVAQGGALAAQLASLYDYMVLTIARANVTSDLAKLEEVDRLLAGLEESWREIATATQLARVPLAMPLEVPLAPPARRESLSYGKI